MICRAEYPEEGSDRDRILGVIRNQGIKFSKGCKRKCVTAMVRFGIVAEMSESCNFYKFPYLPIKFSAACVDELMFPL